MLLRSAHQAAPREPPITRSTGPTSHRIRQTKRGAKCMCWCVRVIPHRIRWYNQAGGSQAHRLHPPLFASTGDIMRADSALGAPSRREGEGRCGQMREKQTRWAVRLGCGLHDRPAGRRRGGPQGSAIRCFFGSLTTTISFVLHRDYVTEWQ